MKKILTLIISLFCLASVAQQPYLIPTYLQVKQGTKKSSFIKGTDSLQLYWSTGSRWTFDNTANKRIVFADSVSVPTFMISGTPAWATTDTSTYKIAYIGPNGVIYRRGGATGGGGGDMYRSDSSITGGVGKYTSAYRGYIRDTNAVHSTGTDYMYGKYYTYDSIFNSKVGANKIVKTTGTGALKGATPGIDFYSPSDTSSTIATKYDILDQIKLTLNGNGNIIQTGHYGGYVKVPFTGHIIKWALCEGTNVSTTTTLDVWKVASASFPPTVANTICTAPGGAFPKPALAGVTYATNTVLYIPVTQGDWIAVNVDANNNALILNFILTMVKK